MFLLPSVVILHIATANTYNLIYQDVTNYPGDNQIYGFWGLNVDLSNPNSCCNGTLIYNWTGCGFCENEVLQYSANGTYLVGPAQALPEVFAPESIVTIDALDPVSSFLLTPQTQSGGDCGDSDGSTFCAYLVLSHTNKSFAHSSSCPDATGLWLGSCHYDGSLEHCKIHYGCVDTKMNALQTISIYNDTYDITDGAYYPGLGSGLYDRKRDLLWYTVPNFDVDHNIIFEINANDTNMRQYVSSTDNTEGAPFTECHYSEYYDIYLCRCTEVGFCMFDPKTQKSKWLLSTPYGGKNIGPWALIDNGRNLIMIDLDGNVYGSDAMKPAYNHIGLINDLPHLSFNGVDAKLLSFNA